MEDIPGFLIALAFFLLLVPFVQGAVLFRDFVVYSIEYFIAVVNGERAPRFKQIGWLVPYFKKLDERQLELLNKYVPYYAALDYDMQARFEKRLIRFRYEKDFYYTKESEKNRELMITLMCAFAIQVTFGYRKYMLDHFHSIHIHKNSFYLDDNYWVRLSGFTAGSRGYIAISESAFLKSIEYPSDGFNVAIHEFAHAIDICDKVQDDYVPWYTMQRWKNHADEEWEKIQSHTDCFLSDYAKKDSDEFYACAVERFFECPELMKEKMPVTFDHLRGYLQQDPLNKLNPVLKN